MAAPLFGVASLSRQPTSTTSCNVHYDHLSRESLDCVASWLPPNAQVEDFRIVMSVVASCTQRKSLPDPRARVQPLSIVSRII